MEIIYQMSERLTVVQLLMVMLMVLGGSALIILGIVRIFQFMGSCLNKLFR